MRLNLILIFALAAAAGAEPLVLSNAFIHTADPARPRADALAIDDRGIIVAVGTRQQVLQQAGRGATEIDLGGKMILPGFQDVHLHAVEAGINETLCEFEPFDNEDGYRETVRECLASTPTGEWMRGSGVNMANLLRIHPNPVALLDSVSAERPLLILDDLGHGAWANTAALRAAGYLDLKGDPAGGLIVRDKSTGRPCGVVLENAQQRLRNLAYPPNEKNLQLAYESLVDALATLAADGITSVSDAGGYWPQGHHTVWQRAVREDALTVRASNALYVYPDMPFDEQIASLGKLYSNGREGLLRFNQAKIYVDGILSQGTAALIDAYADRTGRGFLYFDPATLNRYARALSESGFQLHFHVTGDRGVRLALDAIGQSAAGAGPHRLTHLYLVHPDDYGRFKALNAVADLQLAPSSLDAEYLSFLRGFIGSRADRMMPAASLIAQGATVTLSSDWDADELSPLLKIQTALLRKQEGIADLARAIEAVTIHPARLLRHSDRTGSITPGKYADLVILDENLFEVPPEEIAEVSVRATLLAGEAVYDPSGLFGKRTR